MGVTNASSYRVSCVSTNSTGPSTLKLQKFTKAASCRIAPDVLVAEAFYVIAYPNPPSSEFTIDVQSLARGVTGVQVYDKAGRLIEQRRLNSNSVEIVRNDASGVQT